MSNDYNYSDDDYEGIGTSEALPKREYLVEIIKAESKQDKNKNYYLALQLKVIRGDQAGKFLWVNYLLLAKELRKSGKSQGKRLLRPQTASFLKAIGSTGIPAGAPGGPDASTLVGWQLFIKNGHRFEVEGVGEVEDWMDTYKTLLKEGKLEGVPAQNSPGLFREWDDFDPDTLDGGSASSQDSADDGDAW